MKYKKLAAMAASTLMLAGSYTAFAVDAPESGSMNSTVIEAVCDLPEIKVTVPTTGELFINPYEMPVEINGEYIGYQIVSTPTVIQNESTVPLKVSATVTGAIKEGSDMTLSSSSVDPKSTKKKAFIYFEIQPTNDPETAEWDSGYDANKHIVVRTSPKSKKNMVTLDIADEAGEKKCYGAFRLTGDCAAVPKIGWTEADGVNVTIAFTFTATSTVQ